jgi:hypothetical protein
LVFISGLPPVMSTAVIWGWATAQVADVPDVDLERRDRRRGSQLGLEPRPKLRAFQDW